MTDQEMRIAIAKACGWHQSGFGICATTEILVLGPPDEPPDYPNDLNAMHDAEKTLQTQDRPMYQHYLDRVCSTSKDPHCSCWDFIHATARQRAEAFLRTVWKWKDE